MTLTLCALTMLGLIGSSWSQTLTDCNLYTGVGCGSSNGIEYTFLGYNPSYYPTCNRAYNVRINKLTGSRKGVTCYFYTKDPEGMIYSVSSSPTHTGYYSSTTAVIRTRGKAVYIFPKTVSSSSVYKYNYLYYPKLHGNEYNSVSYTFHASKMRMRSRFTSDSFNLGHPYLFQPTVSPLYIGLNKVHGSNSTYTYYRGTGLCRFRCYTTSSSYSQSEPEGNGTTTQAPTDPEDADFFPFK